MNLTLVRWLLKNRDLLVKVIAVASKFDRDGTLLAKWAIADEIARLVIPVMDADRMTPEALVSGWYGDEGDEVQAFSMGAQVQAMGLDWQAIVDLVLPLLIAILKALSDNE